MEVRRLGAVHAADQLIWLELGAEGPGCRGSSAAARGAAPAAVGRRPGGLRPRPAGALHQLRAGRAGNASRRRGPGARAGAGPGAAGRQHRPPAAGAARAGAGRAGHLRPLRPVNQEAGRCPPGCAGRDGAAGGALARRQAAGAGLPGAQPAGGVRRRPAGVQPTRRRPSADLALVPETAGPGAGGPGVLSRRRDPVGAHRQQRGQPGRSVPAHHRASPPRLRGTGTGAWIVRLERARAVVHRAGRFPGGDRRPVAAWPWPAARPSACRPRRPPSSSPARTREGDRPALFALGADGHRHRGLHRRAGGSAPAARTSPPMGAGWWARWSRRRRRSGWRLAPADGRPGATVRWWSRPAGPRAYGGHRPDRSRQVRLQP